MNQRPLCIANDNTCPNLAENKGKSRTGKTRYGKLCDSHRRKGHGSVQDPKSRRYIPLDNCSMCLTEKATDRHRIIQGGEYVKENIITLCKPCHQKVHRFYGFIKSIGYSIIKL